MTRDQIRPVDPILEDLMLDYKQDEGTAIVDGIFPKRPIKGETAWYYVFEANQKFRRYKALRADGTEARAIKIRLTTATLKADEYSLKMAVTDRERGNELGALSLDQEAGFHVNEALLLDREMRARDIVLPTGYSLDDTASPLWTAANATPMANNEAYKAAFKLKNGRRPNTMIVPQTVWATWQDPTVTGSIGWIIHEKLKYTTNLLGRDITPELLAQLFGVKRVLIADMMFTDTALTSAIVGTAGITSGAFIWNTQANNSTAVNEVIYTYVDDNAGPKTMTYGKAFQAQPLQWSRYRENKLKKDWIEGSMIEVLKVIAPSAIYRVKVK